MIPSSEHVVQCTYIKTSPSAGSKGARFCADARFLLLLTKTAAAAKEIKVEMALVLSMMMMIGCVTD
jgi:hypothetical protein